MWWKQSDWMIDENSVKNFLFLQDSGHRLYTCLRRRGLVPWSMSEALLEEVHRVSMVVGMPTGKDEVWHTDGSKPCARKALAPDFAVRAGAGAVCIRWSETGIDSAVALLESVPGRQTVPRAELHAAGTVMRTTSTAGVPSTEVDIIVEHRGSKRTMAAKERPL